MFTSRVRFGLYPASKETTVLERVTLPLKAVRYEFTVQAGFAEVSLTQVFRQENRHPVDCIYLFPAPADSAVYECEAFINDRVIRARIEERARAARMAAEQKRAGRRTALVEAERENLFTLTLGNLQPEDLVEVRLAYIQPLRRFGNQFSLEIPMCPGVRYVPGSPLLRSQRGAGTAPDTDIVPDASRISPPRIDSLHPDAAFVDIAGKMDAGFVEFSSIASPSHETISRLTEGTIQLRLQHQDTVPDRDFVLRWDERAVHETTPRAWLKHQGNHNYALIEIRAPQLATADDVPQDLYVLLDRSGSMEGEKWARAVEALQACVADLRPTDRVMITLFADRPVDFAEAPLPAGQVMQDPRFQKLAEVVQPEGGTEMASAFEHVVEVFAREPFGRLANLILITDAQVGDDARVLAAIRSASSLPVHCFGIDVALNDALLLDVVRQQGGTFHSLSPRDDVKAAVSGLYRTLRQPVLRALRLEG